MKTLNMTIEKTFTDMTEWIWDHRYRVVCFMLFMTAGFTLFITRLSIDTRDESYFHQDDPLLRQYHEFRQTFGQDDMFIIALETEAGLTQSLIPVLIRLHQDLEASVPYVHSINSLVNGRVVKSQGDALIVEPLMGNPPRPDMDTKALNALIDQYPLYENLLVSSDRTAVSIVIRARTMVGQDSGHLSHSENIRIYQAIRKVTQPYEDQGLTFYFGGRAVFTAETQQAIITDLTRIIPLSFGVIILFLCLLFLRLSGVILPLIVIALPLAATFGIMGLAGIPVTITTLVVPTLMTVVGIGDSIHLLAAFFRNLDRTLDKRRSMMEASGKTGLPILMTSLTTAAGLLSFIPADLKSISDLGRISALGVILAFLYTVVLLPALIAVFPVKPRKIRQHSLPVLTDRLFDGLARLTARFPGPTVIVSLMLFTSACLLALSLRFSHNALTWFPENSPTRRSAEFIDGRYGGSVNLEALVDFRREDALYRPDILNRLDRAAKELEGIAVHGITASRVIFIGDIIKEINRALHDDSRNAYTIPDSRELIAQELLLFDSTGNDSLAELTDSAYRTARISILAPFSDAVLYADYVETLKNILYRQFPDADISLTGNIPLLIQMINHFMSSMTKSYLFSLTAITLLMAVMLRNTRITLIGMTANIIPILLVFGIMGLYHIPVDMFTILIGSICLGIIVDDTIHFLHHFNSAMGKKMKVGDAVRSALDHAGNAILITSLILASGFFIYMTAGLTCTARFGLLTGCAVIFAAICDFTLIPALLQLIYEKKQKTD